MPRLARSQWYDLTRDMNWDFSYATEEEVFPELLSNGFGVPTSDWWTWDEPYKITYAEYVHNQAGKDAGLFSVNNVVGRSKIFDNLDPGWLAAVTAHYGAIAVAEYQAGIGEARMARFGRAAAWRNMATYGALDETRHGQLQTYFPYQALSKEPRLDWAHKAYHTNEWGIIASRHLFDDMFTANDAVSMAIQLTFTFETGFTNLQFLGMAADAMKVGDIDFGSLISSIQTDEARHAQQGEPTLKILVAAGKRDIAQALFDKMFWRAWKVFALLTGLSMDYYTPLEHRTHSFKEFMDEFINTQFIDQFRDFGLEPPWYWDRLNNEMSWVHHAYHLGVYFWRPTVWWNPVAGVGPEERAWLEEKYPGWNDSFGKYWDEMGDEHPRRPPRADAAGDLPGRLQQLPAAGVHPCRVRRRLPRQPAAAAADPRGRTYTFCSEPCQWVFEQTPEQFKGHTSIIDRLLGGVIQPPTIPGALAYMGLSPEECGQDGTDYDWAHATAPVTAGPAASGAA